MYIPTPFRWFRMSSFPHIGSKRFAGYNPRSPKLLGQRLIIYGSQKKLNWLTRIPVVKEYLRPTLLQMLCRRFRKQKWYTSYLFISTPKNKTFQLDTHKKKNAENLTHLIPDPPHLQGHLQRLRLGRLEMEKSSCRSEANISAGSVGERWGVGLQEIHGPIPKITAKIHSSTGFYIRLMFFSWKYGRSVTEFIYFFVGVAR